MSKSKKIHTNVLKPSTQDMVELGFAVEERFIILCRFFYMQKGYELVLPAELDKDIFLWRTMRVRHKSNDFRNTDDEKKSTRRVAEWTYKVNCEVRNQEYKPLLWGD